MLGATLTQVISSSRRRVALAGSQLPLHLVRSDARQDDADGSVERPSLALSSAEDDEDDDDDDLDPKVDNDDVDDDDDDQEEEEEDWP